MAQAKSKQRKTRMSRGAKRPVAGREEILRAARLIGIRKGWSAVTIRAVAQRLGYTSPLLYQHFRNKQEILIQLAIEGQLALARELARDLPEDSTEAILVMVERYWTFLLEHSRIYRLMNGMDGVLMDTQKVTAAALEAFKAAGDAIGRWLTAEGAEAADAAQALDEIWALLHGMAALYLDRGAPFHLERAQTAVLKLLIGTKGLSGFSYAFPQERAKPKSVRPLGP